MANDDPLVDNVSDAQQVRRARTTEKKRREQLLADLRAVLKTGEGRRVLWAILGNCRTFESVYDENALRMAHRAGRQDLGHELMADIDAAQPDAFVAMMKEHSHRSR